MDVCANLALMLDFKLTVLGVATIDLTQDEDVVEIPPFRGNITPATLIASTSFQTTPVASERSPGFAQLTLVQVQLHPSHQLQLNHCFPQTWRSHPSLLVTWKR